MNDYKLPEDALFTQRIRLLDQNPELYFREYPRPKFGFTNEESSEDTKE